MLRSRSNLFRFAIEVRSSFAQEFDFAAEWGGTGNVVTISSLYCRNPFDTSKKAMGAPNQPKQASQTTGQTHMSQAKFGAGARMKVVRRLIWYQGTTRKQAAIAQRWKPHRPPMRAKSPASCSGSFQPCRRTLPATFRSVRNKCVIGSLNGIAFRMG